MQLQGIRNRCRQLETAIASPGNGLICSNRRFFEALNIGSMRKQHLEVNIPTNRKGQLPGDIRIKIKTIRHRCRLIQQLNFLDPMEQQQNRIGMLIKGSNQVRQPFDKDQPQRINLVAFQPCSDIAIACLTYNVILFSPSYLLPAYCQQICHNLQSQSHSPPRRMTTKKRNRLPCHA